MSDTQSVQMHEFIPLIGKIHKNNSDDKLSNVGFSLSNYHQYYDSIHSLYFQSNIDDNLTGKIKMIEGGGQSITFNATGKYQFIPINESCGQLKVTDLVANKMFYDKPHTIRKRYNDFTVNYTVDNSTSYVSMPYGGDDSNPIETQHYEHNCSIHFELDPLKAGYSLKRLDHYKEQDDIYFNINRIVTIKELIDEGSDFTLGKEYFSNVIEVSKYRRYNKEVLTEHVTQLLLDMETDNKIIDEIVKIINNPQELYNMITFYDNKVNMIGFIMYTHKTEPYESLYCHYMYVFISPKYKDKIVIENYLFMNHQNNSMDWIKTYKTIHMAIPENININDDKFTNRIYEKSDLFSKNMMNLIKNNKDTYFNEQNYENHVLFNM